jgi:hypothetical protein
MLASCFFLKIFVHVYSQLTVWAVDTRIFLDGGDFIMSPGLQSKASLSFSLSLFNNVQLID